MQLNDTHPAIAVAELMRLLLDEYRIAWEAAWNITRNTFAYTNHTLLPEAPERWQLDMFRSVLQRHLEIIYQINKHFLEEVKQRFPNDAARLARMSLIDECRAQRKIFFRPQRSRLRPGHLENPPCTHVLVLSRR